MNFTCLGISLFQNDLFFFSRKIALNISLIRKKWIRWIHVSDDISHIFMISVSGNDIQQSVMAHGLYIVTSKYCWTHCNKTSVLSYLVEIILSRLTNLVYPAKANYPWLTSLNFLTEFTIAVDLHILSLASVPPHSPSFPPPLGCSLHSASIFSSTDARLL